MHLRVIFVFGIVIVSNSWLCFSGNLVRFNRHHSRLSIEDGLGGGTRLESYANELVSEYIEATNKPDCKLGTEFALNQLELHWMDAVVHPDKASAIPDQVVTYVREHRSNLNDDEVLAIFLLLQEHKRKREITELLELFSPQIRSDIIRHVLTGDTDYIEHTPQLASLSSDETVVWWSTDDATMSSSLSMVIDQCFLMMVMKKPELHKQILPYIEDPDALLSARGFAGLLTEDEKQDISSRFLKGKYFRYPLGFVFSPEMGKKYLDQYLNLGPPLPAESRYLYEKFPKLVDERLPEFCRGEDLFTISYALQFLRQASPKSVANDPSLCESVSKCLNETDEFFLNGPMGWQVLLSALELETHPIRVSPAVATSISPDKLDLLNRTADEITKSCRLTLKARSLREAVLAVLASKK